LADASSGIEEKIITESTAISKIIIERELKKIFNKNGKN
jgi:hypothetical protein